ncbi:MAG: hypothetical protein LBV23_09945 [Deltaproteobacteria bacterium]|jgi:hypothetical protein|nr:hypothetical protein [Deltaproteobacteria bacterium]
MSRKAKVESYIRYQTRTSDGKKYATFCPSERRHGGKDLYLGIAIDDNEGIFFNRKSGYFRFTVEGGRSELNHDEAEYIKLIQQREVMESAKPLILDFRDAWFLEHVMETSGIKKMLEKVFDAEDKDTLLSLIAFKILDTNANCYAQRWFDGSYAHYLYPDAKLY